jgi:hypothetical protein
MRCKVSRARNRSSPPATSSSVAQPAQIVSTISGMSGDRPPQPAFVGAFVAGTNRVGVARVDEVDDQNASLLVDVDRDLVGRLAGEEAPDRHGAPGALPPASQPASTATNEHVAEPTAAQAISGSRGACPRELNDR